MNKQSLRPDGLKKWWVVFSAVILAGILVGVINGSKDKSLVNPTVIETPIPSSSPTPKTFKFDRTSDLKKELESVNPAVLDSDFE